MSSSLQIIKESTREFEQEVLAVKTLRECEDLRHRYLGKKGVVKALFANSKNIETSERKVYTAEFNKAKAYVESSLTETIERTKA